MTWPHPSTHPPTHQTINPPMNGKSPQISNPKNRIEISWLVQVLLNFDWFWGSLREVEGGWMGVGVVRGCPLHMCMCMHAHAHSYDIIGNSQGFPQWGCHLQLKLSCLTCICACVCACVCMHVHMCGGILQPPLTPRAAGSPKHQKLNKSWTNRDSVWRFFTSEHSWTHIDYSWSPKIPPTHLPHPPEPRKPKSEELQ